MAQTNEAFDPREAAGIVTAIPKAELRRQLEVRGISKEGFGKMCGATGQQFSEWVSGSKRMKDERLIRAAQVLGVPVLDLLDVPTDTNSTEMRKALQGALKTLRDGSDEAVCRAFPYHYDEHNGTWSLTALDRTIDRDPAGDDERWNRLRPRYEYEDILDPECDSAIVQHVYLSAELGYDVSYSIERMAPVIREIVTDFLRTIPGDYRDLRELVSRMCEKCLDDELDALARDVQRHI